MANTEAVDTIAALQTAATYPGAVTYLTEVGREGVFIWRSGNFAAQIAADPRKGLYVPSAAAMPSIGCWVRDWDGSSGRPEWFGAVPDDPVADNRAAIRACMELCAVTMLAARDYYIRDTLVLDLSGRSLIGVPGVALNRDVGVGPPARMGKRGASRVILTGPKVVEATVLLLGKTVLPHSDGPELVRDTALRNLVVCRDNDGALRARGSRDGTASGCVAGIVCSGLSSALIENVSSFDSPVGWYCHGCVYSKWDDCAAWRSTPAADPAGDFSVGFLIGGYAINYGYAGANASVYFNRCVSYDLKGGSISLGLKLFGAIADTYLTQVEVGRCSIGIEIDGRDAAGHTIPVEKNRSQQNVHLIDPVIDSTSQQGLQLRNLNSSLSVSIVNPYIATAGALADISVLGGVDRVEGHVSIVGGMLLSGGGKGLIAADGVGISVLGTLFRNYGTPISLSNCGSCRIEPDIYNYDAVATNALYLKDLRRSSIKPIVRGAAGRPGFAVGIQLDGGENNAIDPTMVDPDAFTAPAAERKVRYGGEDARRSEAFRAAGNVLIGVTG